MEIIVGRKGAQPFAITDKSVSGKHLKLTTLDDGKVQVEDLGSTNGTFVDGVRIIKKVVTMDTVVRMGSYAFQVRKALPTIAFSQTNSNAASKLQDKMYSIAHLDVVWSQYEEALEKLQRKQQEMNKQRTLPIIISCASGATAPILASLLAVQTLYITVPIALISLFIYIKNYRQVDTSIDDRKAIVNKLMDEYTCPNPDCKRYLGAQPYRVIRQYKKCPYCQCKYTT